MRRDRKVEKATPVEVMSGKTLDAMNWLSKVTVVGRRMAREEGFPKTWTNQVYNFLTVFG